MADISRIQLGNTVYNLSDLECRSDVENLEQIISGITSEVPYVTPEMYGAVGDGLTDDRVAIQSALDSSVKNVVFKGNYLVSLDENGHALTIPSNKNIVLGKSTISLAENENSSYIILVLNGDNINITGGTIIGDRDTFEGESSEWCYGISNSELAVSNIVIDGVTITSTRGDGIGFDGAKGTNVVIQKCTIDGVRRNGISIAHAENMIISDCIINNVSGIAPNYAIDLEATVTSQILKNIIVDNCVMNNNRYGTVNILSKHDEDSIKVTNCVGDGGFGIYIAGDNTVVDCDNNTIKPKTFISSDDQSWAYGADCGLVVGCPNTSYINIGKHVVDCENDIACVFRFSEISGTTHCNINVNNLIAINGNARQVYYNRAGGTKYNNHFVYSHNITLTNENDFTEFNDVSCSMKIKRLVTMSSGSNFPCASDIVITSTISGYLTASCVNGTDMYIYNNANEGIGVSARFTDGTSQKVVGEGKCGILKYIPSINKIQYISTSN